MLITADYLFAVTFYVAFRNIRPGIVTMLSVFRKLLENKIDITHLQIATAHHCQ
jgi:hypothetical protein